MHSECNLKGYNDFSYVSELSLEGESTVHLKVKEYYNDMEIVFLDPYYDSFRVIFTLTGFGLIVRDWIYETNNSFDVSKFFKISFNNYNNYLRISASEDLIEMKPIKLIRYINVLTITVGTGWNSTKFTNDIEIIDSDQILINSRSVGFTWDIMNQYDILFNNELLPYRFSNKISLIDNNFQIRTYYGTVNPSCMDVSLEKIEMQYSSLTRKEYYEKWCKLYFWIGKLYV